MSGLLVRDRHSPDRARARPGTRPQAELLLQPRFRLADSALAAVEASALRPRARLSRLTSEPSPWRETSRDVARDGAMLRDACSLAAAWDMSGAPTLSLRITEMQVASGMLAELIAEILAECRLPPERMELEFSEDSLQVDANDLSYLLAALRDLGIGLVLGGFGGHVSSLTLLRRRSLAGLLSGLKLHPLLMHELGASNDDAAFLDGLVATAHALGLLVVAEGVDTETQASRLRSAGCDQALGSWLGEARPALEAIRALHSIEWHAPMSERS